MDYTGIIDKIGTIYKNLADNLKTEVSAETSLPEDDPYVVGVAGALSKGFFNYAVILLYDKMKEKRGELASFSDELDEVLNGLADCRPVPRDVLDNIINKREQLLPDMEELFASDKTPSSILDEVEQVKNAIDQLFENGSPGDIMGEVFTKELEHGVDGWSNDDGEDKGFDDDNTSEIDPINFDELGTINPDGSVNYERLAHAIVSICNDLTMKGVGHTQMMDASAMASIATGTMLYIFATILVQGQIFKYTHNQIEYKLEEAKMMKSFASAFLVPIKALKKGVAKTSFDEAKETLEYADQGDSFPVKDSMKKIAAIIGLTWNR